MMSNITVTEIKAMKQKLSNDIFEVLSQVNGLLAEFQENTKVRISDFSLDICDYETLGSTKKQFTFIPNIKLEI